MIKTTLHHYCFDINYPDQKAAWGALKKQLAPILYLQMNAHSGGNQPITRRNDSEAVELEVKHLFDNQWNEIAVGDKSGRRLFDWYLEYRLTGQHIKQGHWLLQTQEMIDIRNNTRKCGYCGAQSTGPEEFHTACLGSQYLKQDDIYLIRMRAVSERPRQFPKLTKAEASVLIPAYEVAQGLGAEEREKKAHSRLRKKVAALVPDAERKAAELIAEAEKKTTAYTWLLDHKFRELDNVIYYSHTDKFCFGWREPYGADASVLRESLEGFPFDYEVK